MAAREPGAADPAQSEASELFAGFVALRVDGESVPFEDWVREHPDHEPSLRKLYRLWPEFEQELGRLRHHAPAQRPAPELRAGAVLGDFRLVSELGKGGMGQVWLAHGISLPGDVALKVLLPERCSSRGIAFFAREERAMRRVRHPDVVRVLDAGVDGGLHWIAQEYVPGGRTLADLLDEARRGESLQPQHFTRIARLFARIAAAVAELHACGVVHRDLKPQNVLLAGVDWPKVCDFGLASILDEGPLSRTGDLVGTLFYMSPEQVTGKRIGLDARTDVFSLGAMLYEALTLRRPFLARTNPELSEKILYEDPPDPDRVRPEVPRALASICTRAMEKRRGDRFVSMREMADELERFLAARPIRTRPPGVWGRARRAFLRRPARHAAVAVATVGAIALGLLAWRLSVSEKSSRRSDFEAAMQQAVAQISAGDRTGAFAQIERAGEIAPDDPRPNLYRAYVHSLIDGKGDLRREIREAQRKGFDPGAVGETAEDQWILGIYLFCSEDPADRLEAERVLARATELDPTLAGAHFLLYRLRAERGDDAGALEALRGYRRCLREAADPELVRLVGALELRMRGDAAGAVDALEELRRDPTADAVRLAMLDVDRFLGVEALVGGESAVAIASLERTLQAHPESVSSRVNYVNALLASVDEMPRSERRERFDAALEAARAAVELDPLDRQALYAAASTAVLRLENEPDEYGLADWQEARERIDAALEQPIQAESLRRLSGLLRILDAKVHDFKNGWYGAAASGLAAGLEEAPDHLPGRLWLAQALWFEKRYGESLDELEGTLSLLSSGEGRAAEPSTPFLGAVQVWVLWAAGELGRDDRCEEALSAINGLPERGEELEPMEAVTFAEFLAAPPPGLERFVDCERVHALFDHKDLWHLIDTDLAFRHDAESSIAQIEKYCYPKGR